MTFDSLKNSSLLTSGTGIVALALPAATPLDSTGAVNLMTNTHTLYANSNLKSDPQSSASVTSLVTGGTGTTVLANIFNAHITKSVG